MKTTHQPPCGDAAVKARTGRDWSEWCVLIDAEGAQKLAIEARKRVSSTRKASRAR